MLHQHLIPFHSRKRRDLWDPFRIIGDLFEETESSTGLAPRTWTSANADFIPRLDVVDGEKDIRIEAELPGLKQKDIDVSLADDVLTIQGEKTQETEKKEENYYRLERSYGRFHREVLLPADTVEADQIDAKFKNGVLTVTLPKKTVKEEAAKKIEIKAG